jgi:hypothetical protein
MDLNLLIAILVAVILIIISIEYEDGFLLFIMGFLNLGVVLNIDTLFGITQTSYHWFGNLMQLIYVFIAIFCFTKMVLSAREEGIFTSLRNHGRK